MQSTRFSVVQIIDRLHTGGAERVLVLLANLLHQHGHKVSVITTVSGGPLAAQLDPGIPLINLKRGWKWNPVTMYRLIRLIRPFDIVHVHSAHNLRYVFLSAMLFRLHKPIFFHEHFGDININQSVSRAKKFIYPKTILIAVSKQIADWAVQQLYMPVERVFVLANTVAKESVTNTAPPTGNVLQLVMVANIRPTKNIVFAIQLCAALNTKMTKPVHLTIIGQVADAAYYETVQRQIRELQLEPAITLITNCHNVQPLLHNYHLALHTAVSESGPLVLIEYMAQQLPFLTYATGEVAAQVQHVLPQLVMHQLSIPAWTERIRTLVHSDNTTLKHRMATLFQQHYSADAYYRQCMAIYTKGLQEKL